MRGLNFTEKEYRPVNLFTNLSTAGLALSISRAFIEDHTEEK
jgi:hypothetical protein